MADFPKKAMETHDFPGAGPGAGGTWPQAHRIFLGFLGCQRSHASQREPHVRRKQDGLRRSRSCESRLFPTDRPTDRPKNQARPGQARPAIPSHPIPSHPIPSRARMVSRPVRDVEPGTMWRGRCLETRAGGNLGVRTGFRTVIKF